MLEKLSLKKNIALALVKENDVIITRIIHKEK